MIWRGIQRSHFMSNVLPVVMLLVLLFVLPVTSVLQDNHHLHRPSSQQEFTREIHPPTSLTYSVASSPPDVLPVSFSEVNQSPSSLSLPELKQKHHPVTTTTTTVPTTTSDDTNENTCEVARTRCAYRMGCGMALQSYMISCADLISNRTNVCSVKCQTALIALMSTEEGEDLIDCDCDGSSFCQLNKERIEVCRSEVMRARAEDSVISCQTARAICLADLPCSTALNYYYNRCRMLFQTIPGTKRRCTKLCKNSLDILSRQEKAAKMKTCYCEGSEDFNCQRIKESTEQLCLNPEEISNSIPIFPSSTSSASRIYSFYFTIQRRNVAVSLPVLTSITTLLLLLLPFFLTSRGRSR